MKALPGFARFMPSIQPMAGCTFRHTSWPRFDTVKLYYEYPNYMRMANTPADRPETSGNVIALENWKTSLQRYLAYCKQHGLEPKDLTAFN
jgi:hypothetical protein